MIDSSILRLRTLLSIKSCWRALSYMSTVTPRSAVALLDNSSRRALFCLLCVSITLWSVMSLFHTFPFQMLPMTWLSSLSKWTERYTVWWQEVSNLALKPKTVLWKSPSPWIHLLTLLPEFLRYYCIVASIALLPSRSRNVRCENILI